MTRAVVIVLDSVGIGGAPDAASFGDDGADTVGHIAAWCAAHRTGQDGGGSGLLRLPHLAAFGLGEACRVATGKVPPGLEAHAPLRGAFGSAREISSGKDTPSGHWELAGVPVEFEWGGFPQTVPCFPRELIQTLCHRCDLPGVLGQRHASGTQIIGGLGDEHIRTGKPICYTSADSVFQIAAHETAFGLQKLYDVCAVARELTRPLNIARVIARPFAGDRPDTFERTANRRDWAEPPPRPTLLDIATASGRNVVSLGKTVDIFAHSGTGRNVRGHGNADLCSRLLDELPGLPSGGLLFANLVDFDSSFGHRRDVAGYAAALEAFDQWLPALEAALRPGDLAVITADHGCDPTWVGTDHTREQVPVLAFGPGVTPRCIGERDTFADVGASVAAHLGLPRLATGVSFL